LLHAEAFLGRWWQGDEEPMERTTNEIRRRQFIRMLKWGLIVWIVVVNSVLYFQMSSKYSKRIMVYIAHIVDR